MDEVRPGHVFFGARGRGGVSALRRLRDPDAARNLEHDFKSLEAWSDAQQGHARPGQSLDGATF